MRRQMIGRVLPRTAALFGITALITVAAPAAHANLLTNGSFEQVSAAASPFFIRSFASTPGWTQFGDGVDLIHNNYTQGPTVLVDASDGVQFLDMNQGGSLGGIRQVVDCIAGVSYRLDLDTCAWAQNSIPGTIGYELYDPISSAVLAQGSYADTVGGQWVARSLTATATSSQIGVRIQGISANQAGMGLDNVRLNVATAAVPEPASLALLVSGVGLLTLRFARRRKAS
jgi:hypothetical protein